MDTLFGIKSYIPIKASVGYDYSNPLDLMEKVLEFCFNKE
jgi:hypothetical protein